MERPRLTRARVIFGVATLLGLFSAFQAYQAALPLPQSEQLDLAVAWNERRLLVRLGRCSRPSCSCLARRFPFERGVWLRSLPVHLVACCVVTVAHIGAVRRPPPVAHARCSGPSR